MNYHRSQVAKETFQKVDSAIWKMLWRWCYRRHPNKPRKWIKDRYFHRQGNWNWAFAAKVKDKDGKERLVKLVNASDTPIRRHIKIKGEANPFDPKFEAYFEKRLEQKIKEDLKGKRKLLNLWLAQEGKCPACGEKITRETGWNLHHVTPRCMGGSDAQSNLKLLHPNCHRQHHSLMSRGLPAPVTGGFAEA